MCVARTRNSCRPICRSSARDGNGRHTRKTRATADENAPPRFAGASVAGIGDSNGPCRFGAQQADRDGSPGFAVTPIATPVVATTVAVALANGYSEASVSTPALTDRDDSRIVIGSRITAIRSHCDESKWVAVCLGNGGGGEAEHQCGADRGDDDELPVLLHAILISFDMKVGEEDATVATYRHWSALTDFRVGIRSTRAGFCYSRRRKSSRLISALATCSRSAMRTGQPWSRIVSR